MENKLTVGSGSLESFISSLNNATGFNSNLIVIPHLKFNADKGLFEKETGEKDKDNKPVYEEIGESVEFQIITSRKMVITDRKSKIQLYSREFQDNYVELFDQDKKMVMKGFYKDLKAANEHLVYIQVLYIIMDGKPYRFKMSGSKLTSLFPYLNSFKGDSPVRYLTKAKKGEEKTNGGVKYYELILEKGNEISDKELIISRVNDINYYIDQMSKLRTDNKQIDEPVRVEPTDDDISMDEIHNGEEINPKDIPF